MGEGIEGEPSVVGSKPALPHSTERESGHYTAQQNGGGGGGGGGEHVYMFTHCTVLCTHTIQLLHIFNIQCIYVLHIHVLMREEKKKHGQTNKQGRATPHTQGSHFS